MEATRWDGYGFMTGFYCYPFVVGQRHFLQHSYRLRLIPLSEEAIGRTVELNSEAVKMNEQAFFGGRLMADDASVIERVLGTEATESGMFELERFVADRVRDLEC